MCEKKDTDLRNELFYQQKNGYDLIDTEERLEQCLADIPAWLKIRTV